VRGAQETGGAYGVALDEHHMEELVLEHAPPPPTLGASVAASLVRMGFPQRNAEGPASVAFVGAQARALVSLARGSVARSSSLKPTGCSWALVGMQNRILGPYSAAVDRIIITETNGMQLGPGWHAE
jgi:Ssl1-like